MNNNFEEVSSDIIELISSLHYEETDKELIKLRILCVLYKMVENEQTFNRDTKILDDNTRRKK